MRINPDLPEPYNLLGILYERNEREEAREEFLKALKLKPDYPVAYFNLGNFYFKRNLFSESEAHYEKAIEFNPKFANALNNLAVVCFNLKKYDSALKYLKEAESLGLKVNPDFKRELTEKIRKKR
jgi:tetratricopeptide (TPR) repeat protein